MTDPRTQAYQRHAAQRALVVLSADARIRVVDPTVRQTIKLLADYGLLRLPPGERAGGRERRTPRRSPAAELQPLLEQLKPAWSDAELESRIGLSRGSVRRIRSGATRSVNSETRDAVVKFHSAVYNPAL